jgi:hypothetical protein
MWGKRMSIENLRTLSLNPFTMSKIIQNFIDGYNQKVDIRLLFYVLPIILYKDSRDKLSTAKNTSRMDTLFGSKHPSTINENIKLSGKINLSGFYGRFEELKGLTKQTIIIMTNDGIILLGNEITLLRREKYDRYTGELRATLKAAFYLGVILSKASQEYLDDFLGVKAI